MCGILNHLILLFHVVVKTKQQTTLTLLIYTYLVTNEYFVIILADTCNMIVENLEFLKKYVNLQTSFPDLEKVWKMEIKFGKKWKEVWSFFYSIKSVDYWVKCLPASLISRKVLSL